MYILRSGSGWRSRRAPTCSQRRRCRRRRRSSRRNHRSVRANFSGRHYRRATTVVVVVAAAAASAAAATSGVRGCTESTRRPHVRRTAAVPAAIKTGPAVGCVQCVCVQCVQCAHVCACCVQCVCVYAHTAGRPAPSGRQGRATAGRACPARAHSAQPAANENLRRVRESSFAAQAARAVGVRLHARCAAGGPAAAAGALEAVLRCRRISPLAHQTVCGGALCRRGPPPQTRISDTMFDSVRLRFLRSRIGAIPTVPNRCGMFDHGPLTGGPDSDLPSRVRQGASTVTDASVSTSVASEHRDHGTCSHGPRGMVTPGPILWHSDSPILCISSRQTPHAKLVAPSQTATAMRSARTRCFPFCVTPGLCPCCRMEICYADILYMIVSIALPRRNKGINGTRPSTTETWPTKWVCVGVGS
jgi:hypothetical protein